MLRSILRANKLRIIAGIAVFSSIPAFTQSLDLAGGPAGNATYSNRMLGGASQASFLQAISGGLAFYTANYTSLGGQQVPFNIVGTDPSLGANTTTVPTVIVPLKFIFPNPGNPILDGTNVVTAVQNSPIFLTTDYTVGGTDLGVTQYGDALQRGEFWNLPGFSQNYHVLLGMPVIASTVTVTVPAGQGSVFPLRSGGVVGVLAENYFDLVLNSLLPSYRANQLPIFTTDNVFLSPAPPAVFTKTTNGTTYHLQDEVFLPWYLHTNPSFSVNNWYAFMNTLTSFTTLCGPG